MEIFEILKYTIPALVVFFTAFLFIRFFLRNEEKKHRQEMLKENRKIIMPIRLQAHERITMFLERIAPDSLIIRVKTPGMTNKQLQMEMLNAIRSEFEHNLSQQIYISSKVWDLIKSAKEGTIRLINTAADEVKADAPSIELSKAILEKVMESGKTPSATAIEFIKKEMVQFY